MNVLNLLIMIERVSLELSFISHVEHHKQIFSESLFKESATFQGLEDDTTSTEKWYQSHTK